MPVALPATKASLCDMLENRIEDAPLTDGRITLEFTPFEVKTIRLAVDGAR